MSDFFKVFHFSTVLLHKDEGCESSVKRCASSNLYGNNFIILILFYYIQLKGVNVAGRGVNLAGSTVCFESS